MSLQEDVKRKLLENDQPIDQLAAEFVLAIDEEKISFSKLKSQLLEDVIELVHEELESEGETFGN